MLTALGATKALLHLRRLRFSFRVFDTLDKRRPN
jgi:hypothetical protein